jgi:hypothetical protein
VGLPCANDPRSSNGRTEDFGSSSGGSNPPRGTASDDAIVARNNAGAQVAERVSAFYAGGCCPWNSPKIVELMKEPDYSPDWREAEHRPGTESPSLIELLETALDEAAWDAFARGSALRRAGRAGFLRNVCVGLGNWGSPEAVPVLSSALSELELWCGPGGDAAPDPTSRPCYPGRSVSAAPRHPLRPRDAW